MLQFKYDFWHWKDFNTENTHSVTIHRSKAV